MQDFSREGITWRKILQMFRLFLPKNTRTLLRLSKFSQFNPDKIHKQTGIKIKGIILDVDGTIAHNHAKITPENIKHLKSLLVKGLKIVCYSNMQWTSRYKNMPRAIKVLTNLPPKPSSEGFKMALQQLGVPKKNTAMLGDSYITDGGAIRSGIAFIYVKPFKDKNKNLSEFLQNSLRNFFSHLAKFYSLFLQIF